MKKFHELKGDFWAEAEHKDVDAIVCTINTVCKKDGTLVMGAGIAKDFAERMSWLPDRWGIRTKFMGEKTYPFVEILNSGPAIVGIHTKLDWKKPSPPKLVDRSIKQLYIVARALNWKKILMTRPGCGQGGLSWESFVKPTLTQVLDEHFFIINQE